MLDRLRSLFARTTREPSDPDASRVYEGIRTLAGVTITPDTAVTIPTVWACLRYLSQTVAMPPWHVMARTAKGAEIQAKHPVDWLLWKRPSKEWSSFQFRETLTHWALRWGNGYAEIEPDQRDRPFALWPVHPERVEVCRATDPGVDAYGTVIGIGDLYYEINNGTNGKVNLSSGRVFHIRGFGEGPVGVNVIQYASQSLGWTRAALLFGAAFFGNGATPTTVVMNKRPLTEPGLKRQKAEFKQLYGGPRKAHGTAHLDNDATITRLGLDAEESQLIEVHQHLVEEICRWFGVPPHKVMHLLRGTFSNIEHQSIEVVVDAITPWAKRFEDEADFKLFGGNRQGLYTKMNLNALMRGDTASRIAWYKGMRDMGAYSVNRVLELEDENTIGEVGDKHTMQSGFTTLERIGEEPAEPAPAPDPADATEDDPAAMAAIDEANAILAKEPAHVG